MPTRIFLSYRRSDSTDFTEHLYRALALNYRPDNIFRDAETIPGGTTFSEYIHNALIVTDIMLVIIGPGWAHAANDQGQQRLSLPDDLVRQEIATALRLKRLVIPILVDDTPALSPGDLPTELAPLAELQAYRFHPTTQWDTDFGALRLQIDAYMKQRFIPNFVGLLAAIVFPVAVALTLPMQIMHGASQTEVLLFGSLSYLFPLALTLFFTASRRHFVWLWLLTTAGIVTYGGLGFLVFSPGKYDLLAWFCVTFGCVFSEFVWLRYAFVGPRYPLEREDSPTPVVAPEKTRADQRPGLLGLVGSAFGLVAGIVVWPAGTYTDPRANLLFDSALILISVAMVLVILAFVLYLINAAQSFKVAQRYAATDLVRGFGNYSPSIEKAAAQNLRLRGRTVLLVAPLFVAIAIILSFGPSLSNSPRFAAMVGLLFASLGLVLWLITRFAVAKPA